MGLSRKDFTNAIQAIIDVMETNTKLEDLLDCSVIEYNHRLGAATVSLLSNVMNDKETWIDYWLWELDCGRRDDLVVTEADGTPIPMKTIDDLYNILVDK